jgi:excisionase family DNA binding protein
VLRALSRQQEQPKWLSPEGLAAELGVPVKTVYVWNSKGTGPRAAHMGRHVRYRRADVDAWVNEQYAPDRPAA